MKLSERLSPYDLCHCGHERREHDAVGWAREDGCTEFRLETRYVPTAPSSPTRPPTPREEELTGFAAAREATIQEMVDFEAARARADDQENLLEWFLTAAQERKRANKAEAEVERLKKERDAAVSARREVEEREQRLREALEKARERLFSIRRGNELIYIPHAIDIIDAALAPAETKEGT